jgi:lysophospholipase L1-like esterase
MSFALFPNHMQSGDLLLKTNQIIVCLGNSITEQGEQPHGYVSVMRKALHLLYPHEVFIFVNSGVSGNKSTDMSARFQEDVLDYKPDWVIISVGINDVWHGFYDNHPNGEGPLGVPVTVFQKHLEDMIRLANANKVRVVLFTTTIIKETLTSPENNKLAEYNRSIRNLAKRFNCLLVDQNAAFLKELSPFQKPRMPISGRLTSDGVHMLPPGNWLIARTTLHAFGVPTETLDNIKPKVDSLIRLEMREK